MKNDIDELIAIENRAGVRWELQKTPNGWALGRVLFHGKALEQSATEGVLALRQLKSGEVRWLAALRGEKVDPRTARLSGKQEIEGSGCSARPPRCPDGGCGCT